MGKRQESLFVMADELPQFAGHPFYQRLNALLAEAEFDRWIELAAIAQDFRIPAGTG